MKKFIHLLGAVLMAVVLMNACVKPDLIKRNELADVADVWAEIPGLKERFPATFSANKDTAYINMSYFYPAESDNEIDLTKLILRSSIPVDAALTPSLGSSSDLSKPLTLTVTSGTGVVKKVVVVVQKFGDLSVKKAEISFAVGGATQKVEAIPNGDELVFYVLPGTDLSNAQLAVQISRHSQTSIATGSSVNLNNPVPLTIKGVDGRTKTYTLVAKEPQRLSSGFGINRKLWVKTAAELNFSPNMETSIAASGNHLVVVSRTSPSKYKILNRQTGDFIQDISLPFSALSFQVAADTTGSFIGCSWAPKNATFVVYKWKNALDPSPVKVIEWVNNNPAGIALDGGVGRRVNIFGNLEGNAVIMATAGQSSIIYKWVIKSGVLKNNIPEVINYTDVAGGSSTLMGFYPEAQPLSANENTDFIVNYQFELALVNGTTYKRTAAMVDDANVYGVFHMPTEYTTFNNAKYLPIVKYLDWSLNKVQMSLFDVTDISKLNTPFSNPAYAGFNRFVSETLSGGANANGTADICVGFSPDKERMQVYMLLTNGGIMAHEFTKYAP